MRINELNSTLTSNKKRKEEAEAQVQVLEKLQEEVLKVKNLDQVYQ